MSLLRQAILLYNDILSSLALLWLIIIKLSEYDILMGLTLNPRCQNSLCQKNRDIEGIQEPSVYRLAF